MSRKCERRASRGKGRYYPGLWDDILVTWHKNPDAFEYGCGQSTLARAVQNATGHTWPSHHIRKQLKYAINAGFVRYLRPDEFVDNYRPQHLCTRFKLLKKGPLPMPQQPRVSNVADIVEANGKTIRENNYARTHNIPLKTLVALVRTEEDKSCGCMEDHDGIRAYVVQHQRDCDGTPLYGLALSRDQIQLELMGTPYEKLITIKVEGGFSEDCLRAIDSKREEWPRVPPKGAYVIADHPVTPMNPSRIFRVAEISWGCTCGITVKGNHTGWFAVTMLRLPTPEEAANLDNYHPDEL